jgi:tetratricopeptide (TPR) repeat protein
MQLTAGTRMDPRNLTILVGAGASVDAGLPIAGELSEFLIRERIRDAPTAQELIGLSRQGRSDAIALYDYLRFETILGVVEEIYDEDLNLLRFMDTVENPSALHLALALAATQGARLVTVNFDDLLEVAVRELGFPTFTLDAHTEHLETVPPGAIPVIRLHGTRLKHTGRSRVSADARAAVQATIGRIASRSPSRLLPVNVRQILKWAVDDRDLLVVGYSGSDDLDVVPTLFSLHPRSVTWLNHGAGRVRQVRQPKMEKLTGMSARDKLINHWHGEDVQVTLFEGPTRDLISLLGLAFPQLLHRGKTGRLKWRDEVEAWSRSVSNRDPDGWVFAGLLYSRLDRWDKALHCLAKSTPSSVGVWTPARRHIEIGYCHLLDTPTRTGSATSAAEAALAAAEECQKEGSRDERKNRDDATEARLLLGRALILDRRRDEAIDLLVTLLQETSDEDVNKPHVMHWLGRALELENRPAEALPLLKAASEVFRAKGVLSDLIDAQQALGWNHEAMGRFGEALAAYEEVESISILLGYVEREFDAAIMQASCRIVRGESNVAQVQLTKALSRAREAGVAPDEEAFAWQLLTRIAIENSHWADADRFAEEALKSIRPLIADHATVSLCDKAEVQLLLRRNAQAMRLLDEVEQRGGTRLAFFKLQILGHAADPARYSLSEVVEALGDPKRRPAQTIYELSTTICRLVPPNLPLAPFVEAALGIATGNGNVAASQRFRSWLANARD